MPKQSAAWLNDYVNTFLLYLQCFSSKVFNISSSTWIFSSDLELTTWRWLNFEFLHHPPNQPNQWEVYPILHVSKIIHFEGLILNLMLVWYLGISLRESTWYIQHHPRWIKLEGRTTTHMWQISLTFTNGFLKKYTIREGCFQLWVIWSGTVAEGLKQQDPAGMISCEQARDTFKRYFWSLLYSLSSKRGTLHSMQKRFTTGSIWNVWRHFWIGHQMSVVLPYFHQDAKINVSKAVCLSANEKYSIVTAFEHEDRVSI